MVSGVFFLNYQLSAISYQLSAVGVSVSVRVSVIGQSQSLTNDLLTILSS